jgi:hypothetical protein
VVLSSVQGQPEPVRDMPPPATITPRYVPNAKGAPVVPAPTPVPVTTPPVASVPVPVTTSPAGSVPVSVTTQPVASVPLPVVPLPEIPAPVGLPAVPFVPALGTDAPVLPIPVSLEPKMEPKLDPRPMETGGIEVTIESYARPELPGAQRLFRRDSEKEFFERISQDMKRLGGASKAIFPEEPIISKGPFQPRVFPHVVKEVEPCYVCHRRLYFEQPNFERIGYDYGVLTPALCVGAFYYDLVLLPYHFCTNPQDRTECNVGKCLPGDQAPFLLRHERFSVTGLLGMTGAATGIGLLLP